MATDTRFYRLDAPRSARDIAGELDAELSGNPDCTVNDVASAEAPRPGALVFVGGDVFPDSLQGHDGIVIGNEAALGSARLGSGGAFIRHTHPKAAFAIIAAGLVRSRSDLQDTAIHPTARIASDAVLSPGVCVGADAVIGSQCVLGPNAVIGHGVEIGDRSHIAACAVVNFAKLGRGCRIGPGSVIGEAGFGLAPGPTGLVELPHFGRVVLGDNVRLGANCTIDRGMFGDTLLRDGVKLDNLCHIAHNVDVGEHTLMAAFAGISGSVKIGRGSQFGGRVGVVDHVNIGEGAKLAANASPAWDVPAGETWAGQPAQPIRSWLRELAVLKRLAAPKKRGRAEGKQEPQGD